jgi:hypothetical protein
MYENGTATGLFKQLLDGNAEVAIGFTSLQLTRIIFFSETRAYTTIPLAFVIPPGEEYGEFEKFIRPFSFCVWIAILATFIFACLITIFASNSSNFIYNFLIGEKVKNPFLNVFAVLFGVSQSKLPKGNFARYILMIFIIYALVVRTVYQAGIYNIIKSNARKPEVASIDEMIAEKFDFYIYETLAPRVKDFRFYEFSKVFSNDDIDFYRRKTLDPSFKGVVFNYLDQLLYQNMINFKNFTYHICKERFSTYQFVFYFRKNHYLVDDVNSKIDLMLEFGIIQHINSNYADTKFLKISTDTKQPIQLTLKHFMGAFRLFGISIGFAVSIFAVEMLSMKFRFVKRILDGVQGRMSK